MQKGGNRSSEVQEQSYSLDVPRINKPDARRRGETTRELRNLRNRPDSLVKARSEDQQGPEKGAMREWA
jgi:hypothetical protein